MGSNTCFQLLQTGHHLIKFKNPSNSNPIAPERVAGLVGSATTSQINLLQGDMRNISQLDQTFAKASLPGDAFIHFAELRQGGGASSLLYWEVNVNGICCLLETRDAHDWHSQLMNIVLNKNLGTISKNIRYRFR